MTIILQTPRLTLRQFTEEDAKLIFDLNRDPEVVKYVHERTLESEEDGRAVIKNIILPQYKNDLGRWAIHTKINHEFIGWCGLKYVQEREEIDLGYRLKRPAWGKGYATEAAQHTLDHGFHTLKLPAIIGRAHIENLASLKILEKIGMQFSREEIIDACPVKTFVANNPFDSSS